MTATTVRDVNGKEHDLGGHDKLATGIQSGDVVRLGDGRVVEVYGVRARTGPGGTTVRVLYYQDPVTTGPKSAVYSGPCPMRKCDVAEVLIRRPRMI